MNTSNTQRELFRSCEILFGSELHLSPEFLDYLQVSGVKTAFRKRAMETHPDRQTGKSLHLQKQNTDHFTSVREAYENLLVFLRDKETARYAPTPGSSATASAHKPANGRGADHGRRPEQPSRGPIRPIVFAEDHGPSHEVSSTLTFYQGSLPHRQLLIGHFLYYSGLANWRTIARILTWQRTERPRIGELGRRFGMFDQEDVSTIMHNKKPFSPFGQTARMLGMLSEQQLRVLIFHQQRLQKKFGTILLEKNLLKDYELQELLHQFERHNSAILAERRH